MTIAQNDYIYVPNVYLPNFFQTDATIVQGDIILGGIINHTNVDVIESLRSCPRCQQRMVVNNRTIVKLRHLAMGNSPITIALRRRQHYCQYCHHSVMEPIPFKAPRHFITKALQTYIESLLATETLTLTAIKALTNVHTAIIKDIDRHRLMKKYGTVHDEKGELRYCYRSSTKLVKYIGVDEFSLHRHHKYATIIVDLTTGEVLFVAYGRKKQVIYDFMHAFGADFMQQVEAVATDMNSDYAEAFKEHYPHIEIVYDHFHIVKNFNEGVIAKVRSEEYKRLWQEGKWQEANLLKHSKYLLCANYDNLKNDGKKRLDAILAANQLLFTADAIKDQLRIAYTLSEPADMAAMIQGMICLCLETNNPHFRWFAKLLESHFDGVILHAKYHISTGKVEGINNKIKTIRRQAFGFHDDAYFFLKILDSTKM